MLTAILCVLVISGLAIAFFLGALWGMDREEYRLSARVIRPANINIEKHVHITEYTVQDGALDIDFPNTDDVRNLL